MALVDRRIPALAALRTLLPTMTASVVFVVPSEACPMKMPKLEPVVSTRFPDTTGLTEPAQLMPFDPAFRTLFPMNAVSSL